MAKYNTLLQTLERGQGSKLWFNSQTFLHSELYQLFTKFQMIRTPNCQALVLVIAYSENKSIVQYLLLVNEVQAADLVSRPPADSKQQLGMVVNLYL